MLLQQCDLLLKLSTSYKELSCEWVKNWSKMLDWDVSRKNMEFCGLKTLIGENDSSCIVDPCSRSGRPHIAGTTTIHKVEDLTLILLKVSVFHWDQASSSVSVRKHLAEMLCSILFTHNHLVVIKCLSSTVNPTIVTDVLWRPLYTADRRENEGAVGADSVHPKDGYYC